MAVGEIGFDDMTAAEDQYFHAQLELARTFDLPVLVHTPHRDKKRGTEHTIALLRERALPREHGAHRPQQRRDVAAGAGDRVLRRPLIYPHTKMDEQRMAALVKKYGPTRIVVNSAADWGVSDPLKVPKTVEAMRAAGIAEDAIEKIVWRNPIAFFGQSGRLDLERARSAQGRSARAVRGQLRAARPGARHRAVAESAMHPPWSSTWSG